jgi:O-acetyl-ADP-ribose deacetylase (regulator of RNase III)
MEYVKGDLVAMAKEGNFQVIVHGCNCHNTMGKGIAKSIRKEWPEAYKADCATKCGDKSKLGTFSFSTPLGMGMHIINAYTQFNYWSEGGGKEDLFEYEALSSILKELKKQLGGQGLKFGLPKIGAGLAGGDWVRIEGIIESELKGEDVTIVEYSK